MEELLCQMAGGFLIPSLMVQRLIGSYPKWWKISQPMQQNYVLPFAVPLKLCKLWHCQKITTSLNQLKMLVTPWLHPKHELGTPKCGLPLFAVVQFRSYQYNGLFNRVGGLQNTLRPSLKALTPWPEKISLKPSSDGKRAKTPLQLYSWISH